MRDPIAYARWLLQRVDPKQRIALRAQFDNERQRNTEDAYREWMGAERDTAPRGNDA